MIQYLLHYSESLYLLDHYIYKIHMIQYLLHYSESLYLLVHCIHQIHALQYLLHYSGSLYWLVHCIHQMHLLQYLSHHLQSPLILFYLCLHTMASPSNSNSPSLPYRLLLAHLHHPVSRSDYPRYFLLLRRFR